MYTYTKNRGPKCVYVYKKISYTHVKILQSMSEFGGLWKHQNNLACTKSFGVFRVLSFFTMRRKSSMSVFCLLVS